MSYIDRSQLPPGPDEKGNIALNMKFHKKQLQWLKSNARFKIIRAGRRCGKTYAAVYWLFKRAWTNPGSINWFIAQTHQNSTEIALPMIQNVIPFEVIKKYNRSQKTIELINRSVIAFKTSEEPDNLRGRGVDSLVAEEFAFWKDPKYAWNECIRPSLADKLGHAWIISSPNGSNYFRQLENDTLNNPQWETFTATIYDNPRITRDEIESLRQSTSDVTWRQEYLAEYVDEIGLVYWHFNPNLHTLLAPPKEPTIEIVRGIDWGINDNTGCAFIHLLNNGTVYISNEHVANNLSVDEQCRIILQKSQYSKLPIRYSILDSSCWARDASLSSVAKRFAQHGIPVIPATKDFDGTVSDMKALISANKVLISAKCTNIIQAMQSWNYDDHEPDILAALRYGISFLVKHGKLHPPTTNNPYPKVHPLIAREEEYERRMAKYKAMNKASTMKLRLYDGLS